jgi:hypothetical protein
MLAVALFLWLGLGGPIFKIDWKLDATSLAAWVQAIVSALAILAVYYAATIPVRAEREARARENSIRARGLALLLIPELIALLGELQSTRAHGSIFDPPVLPSRLLVERADQYYLLGEAGGRILQTIGLLSGTSAQTERYRKKVPARPPLVSASDLALGAAIWKNHMESLDNAIANVEEAVEQLRTL